MPFTRVQDIRIYHEVRGDGEPLLMIAGYADHAGHWFRQMPALSRRYRAITFDNRGAGRSDKPDVPYTMQMLADDAAGLLHTLGIDAAHIYGVSMGGMIAQEFALSHPEMTASLVLGCTSCGGAHLVMPDAEVLRVLMDEDRMTSLTPAEAAREMFTYTCSEQFNRANPGVVEQYVATTAAHPAPLHGLKRQIEAIMTHDTHDRLPHLAAPTLVIAGTGDRLMPPANAELLASRMPDAELILLEGVGHGFWYEAVDEANEAIRGFIDRHPISGRR